MENQAARRGNCDTDQPGEDPPDGDKIQSRTDQFERSGNHPPLSRSARRANRFLIIKF